jgi:predicted metal-dependent peptidase
VSGAADGPGVRGLSPPEEHAFRLIRLAAAEQMPYFARALFAMQPAAEPGLGTFAVDRHWRLYMDPALLAGPDAWPVVTAAAVLLHEAGHLIRDHAGRTGSLPAPVHGLAWNLAADAEINDDLLAAGAPLPDGVVTPGALGLPDQGLAEDYYARLLDRPDNLDRFDDGGPGCGSGSGGPALPGELPWEAAAGLPGLGPAGADLVRRAVARDVKEAAGRGRGTMPAGLDRWASGVLAPPAVPWQQVLRGAVRAVIAGAAGRADYTYRRPSRRRVPGVIRPAMRGVSLSVAVVVDTSGSMGAEQLGAALSEIGGVTAASGVSRDQLYVLACDAAAAAPQRVRSVSGIRLTGGGGTDMRVGIGAAAALRPAPNVIIVLTDGDTPWPERPLPRSRLVCAVISPDPPRGTPEWAVTVHVPDGPGKAHGLARARSPVPELA